jgi:hypothetical protein
VRKFQRMLSSMKNPALLEGFLDAGAGLHGVG